MEVTVPEQRDTYLKNDMEVTVPEQRDTYLKNDILVTVPEQRGTYLKWHGSDGTWTKALIWNDIKKGLCDCEADLQTWTPPPPHLHQLEKGQADLQT